MWVAEKKRRKQRDCLHKASHLIAGTLAERAVVIGDLSQRQMVIKKQEHETHKEKRKRQRRNRMVYNDWGLYGFAQMAVGALCTALAGLGKDAALSAALVLAGASLVGQASFWIAARRRAST